MSYNNSLIAVNGNWSIPCPSNMTWGKQDISDSNSGRTQYTGYMYKNKIGEKRKINLQWNAVDIDKATAVLQAFSDEYFNVTYYDPLEGSMVTKEFYCGDMSAPLYSWYEGNKLYNTVTFNIIER